jgi:hypothetical protein
VALQQLGGIINKYVLLAAMLATALFLAWVLHVVVERRYSKLLG